MKSYAGINETYTGQEMGEKPKTDKTKKSYIFAIWKEIRTLIGWEK